MERKAKKYIEKALEIFARSEIETLEKFWKMAEEKKLDISFINRKYKAIWWQKFKNKFYNALGGILSAFAFLHSSVEVYGYSEDIEGNYYQQKVVLKYEIKDYKDENDLEKNTSRLLDLVDFYLAVDFDD